jgi:hypothetical protein
LSGYGGLGNGYTFNCWTVDQDCYLNEIKGYFQLFEDVDVYFYVFQSVGGVDGPYNILLSEKEVELPSVPDAPQQFYSSGDLGNIPLETGNYYAIGACWNKQMFYSYSMDNVSRHWGSSTISGNVIKSFYSFSTVPPITGPDYLGYPESDAPAGYAWAGASGAYAYMLCLSSEPIPTPTPTPMPTSTLALTPTPTATPTSTYTIQVTGSSNVTFSGWYEVNGSIGSTGEHRVWGTVPQTYIVDGTHVLVQVQNEFVKEPLANIEVFLQNTGASGTLTVQILKDSAILYEETTHPYGCVWLQINCSQTLVSHLSNPYCP